MSDFQLRIGQGVLEVPWWWPDAVRLWLALVGLVLFLLGRRLVRPSFGAVGLMIGASAAYLLAATWVAPRWSQAPPEALAALGGILGGLAGFLLWRLGLGVTLAITVALIAPAIALIATHTEGPALTEPWVELRSNTAAALHPNDASGQPAETQLRDVLDPLKVAGDTSWQNTREWWTARNNGEKWMLGTLSVGGGVLAALIALALPYFCAAIVTAMLGVLMMFPLTYRLAGILGESAAGLMPDTPRLFLFSLLGATLFGALLQWTFFRPARKAEG